MSVVDWIPAISTTALLAGALWLLRSLISTRLNASVKHEFERKIEKLKADLRSNETQIEALRGGALTALASRQVALDARRIQAVDELWSAVQALAPAKSVSAIVASVKFKGAAKVCAENPRARELFRVLGGQLGLKDIQTGEAERTRPFVSEMAWAVFSAYRAVLLAGVVKMQILRSGLDVSELVDDSGVAKLLAAVLPHRSEFIKEHETGAYHHLLDELEKLLLQELRRVLQGATSDRDVIEQAGEILRQSEEIMNSVTEAAGRQAANAEGRSSP